MSTRPQKAKAIDDSIRHAEEKIAQAKRAIENLEASVRDFKAAIATIREAGVNGIFERLPEQAELPWERKP